MLESTLTSLLASVAGRYAHLSASDIGVGLSGGHLVLDNVQLRADALNSPALPWRILHGRAGRLRVNVPWSALSHDPVTVYLENIHLVAGPKGPSSTSGYRDDTPDARRNARDSSKYSNVESEEGKTNVEQNKESARAAPLNRNKQFQERWHETLIGRLGFNVAVEVYGLKLEYRDAKTQGIVSLASCKAYSADRDWEPAFAPLDAEETGAVAMRKIISLKGLHCVMIPRVDTKVDERAMDEQEVCFDTNDDRRTQAAQFEVRESGLGRFVVDDDFDSGLSSFGEGDERSLDVDAFEARNPILDGIGLTFKVLLCNSDGPDDGWHLDVDVELEEPLVNISARQFEWIRSILEMRKPDGTLEAGPRRRRRSDSVSVRRGRRSRHFDSSSGLLPRRRNSTESAVSTISTVKSSDRATEETRKGNRHETNTVFRNVGGKKGRRPRNFDHWNVRDPSGQGIDNSGDDTSGIAEDAEVSCIEPETDGGDDRVSRTSQLATGTHVVECQDGCRTSELEEGPSLFGVEGGGEEYDENSDGNSDGDWEYHGEPREVHGRTKLPPTARRGGLSSIWWAIVGEENLDESVDDAAVALGYATSESIAAEKKGLRIRDLPSNGKDRSDHFEALNAVAMAAAAGGYTIRLRISTPDFKARETVAELKAALADERRARSRLEDVDNVLADADARLAVANEEIASLKEKNASLVRELDDLERMTRTASSSKDVMVRQMEAALRKAEQQLQSIAQADADRRQKSGASQGATDMSSTSHSRRRRERLDPSERMTQLGSNTNGKDPTTRSPHVLFGDSSPVEVRQRESKIRNIQTRLGAEVGPLNTNGDTPKASSRTKRGRRMRQSTRNDEHVAQDLEEACSKDGLTVI